MTSIHNDAGDDRQNDGHDKGVQRHRNYQAATRRAEEDGDPVDPRDVAYEAMITEFDVGISVHGIRGRIPRDAPGIWTLHEGAVDVERGPLPTVDLDGADLDVPLLTEAEQWWLFAALWWGMGGEHGGVTFFDLPAMLDVGLRILFGEREDDLADAGLTPDDRQTLRRRLVRTLTREATLVTEHDPLLAWATRSVNQRTPKGVRRPIDRFQRVLLAELVNHTLDLPPGGLRGEHAMRLLVLHTADLGPEKPDADGMVRRNTIFRRLMRAISDARVDGDPRWDAMTLDALRTIGRDDSVEADRELLQEAVMAAWTHEDDFATDRLDVTLPKYLGFSEECVAVVIDRVRKEVLPRIR